MTTFKLHGSTLLRGAAVFLLSALIGTAWAQEGESPQIDVPTLLSDGDFYLERGECSLAQFFFHEALRIDQTSADAHVGRGRALACQGAYPAAIESFQAALNSDPNHLLAHVHLAITYQNQYQVDPVAYSGRLADALDTIQRAERINAEDARVQNTKGIILFQLGDLAQARTTLERAVTLGASTSAGLSNVDRSTIQVNLGRVYRDLNELDLALQAFRRAVVLDPASPTAHSNLGHVAFRLGDCSTAEFELSQAVNLDPSSLSAASQLGIALFECGDVATSIEWLEKATQMDGAVFLPQLYTYLARAYLASGKVDDAVTRAIHGALLSDAATLASDIAASADSYYWLGEAYLRRAAAGDSDRARDAFRKALELDPSYIEAQMALDRMP